jgi:hypothetical protein
MIDHMPECIVGRSSILERLGSASPANMLELTKDRLDDQTEGNLRLS